MPDSNARLHKQSRFHTPGDDHIDWRTELCFSCGKSYMVPSSKEPADVRAAERKHLAECSGQASKSNRKRTYNRRDNSESRISRTTRSKARRNSIPAQESILGPSGTVHSRSHSPSPAGSSPGISSSRSSESPKAIPIRNLPHEYPGSPLSAEIKITPDRVSAEPALASSSRPNHRGSLSWTGAKPLDTPRKEALHSPVHQSVSQQELWCTSAQQRADSFGTGHKRIHSAPHILGRPNWVPNQSLGDVGASSATNGQIRTPDIGSMSSANGPDWQLRSPYDQRIIDVMNSNFVRNIQICAQPNGTKGFGICKNGVTIHGLLTLSQCKL